MFDIKKAKDEAEAELVAERTKRAKESIKDKLRSIGNAQKIVANLNRELEELYAELGKDVT